MKKTETRGFHLAWITVSDFKKAKKFFTETLGLKLESEATEYGWMELDAGGGAKIGVGAESKEDPSMRAGQNAVITLSVDDIQKARAELGQKGVKLIGDIFEVPGHVKMQLFCDPDGNLFQLVEQLS